MRPPDHAEPYHLPEERLYGIEVRPEPDLQGALILLHQAARLVPLSLSGVHAALRIAEDGLRAAQLAKPQPPLLEEEERP